LSGSRILAQTRWLTLSLVVAFCLSLLSPVAVTVASTNLSSGDDAVIADANGDLVRLRSKPGSSGAVLGEFPEGTAVGIIDGPQNDADDTAWYRVTVGGQLGYMAAEFLAPAGSAVATPIPEMTPKSEPTAEAAMEPTVDAESVVVAAAITGTAIIVNTNGDSIRCRASASTSAQILGYLYEGQSVQLTGSAMGSWQPVLCESKSGWVHTDFIGSPSGENPTPTPTPVDSGSSIGTAKITGTNGDGARCRNRRSTSGEIITVLAEGSTVSVRGAQSGDWLPVTCAGRKGYVWASFVSAAGSDDGNSGGNDSGSDVTGTGVIANTNGDGVRCRQKASFDGAIITVLVEGDQVQLRGAKKGDWQPVYCDDKKGYVHADYVSESSGGNPGNDGGSTGLETGDTAQVSGTNGDGVRIRSGAGSSANVVTVLGEGEIVDVVNGSTGDWVAVKYRDLNGFIHKDFLVKAADGGTDEEPHDTLLNGDHAKVTSTLNFRSGPSTSSSVIGLAMEGIVVLVTGDRQNGYVPVKWGDQAGFMHGDYLAWTSDQLSPGSSGVGGDAGNGGPSAVGQAMVDYAQNYLGYPYIWATAGPNSFDCSGFTYWVTKHVLGDDIGRGLWTQVVAGTPVSYGNLKPGDLVFFQNTYTWGLSHVGIYIGNNQFIHAENEETGVRISSITSTYYSTRYYGAVRLG
jgi:uncharacterized protein YgiM (DUF1202 family)